MAQLIANTYEVLEKLGAGGGGSVYRAYHTRLQKEVAIKVYKQTLTTTEEKLRREVDALKNLDNHYIPHVYDYFSYEGNVYSVIDYIKGESLHDKLRRGEHFEQPQVIEWACELLEALDYLHTLPPHGMLHADVKPGNIMITPEGDIRLIDFNIALALGEEGAVRVGHSDGYASPEHYGSEYEEEPQNGDTETESETVADTALDTETKSESVAERNSGTESQKSTTSSRGGLLDVRSDIYSAGATIYHLLSGRRPAKMAENVEPLPVGEITESVARIIEKAMNPNPDLRYQTAAEMLWDFEHLHENDPRTKRLKRQGRIVATVLTTLFLAGGISAFAGSRQTQKAEAAARLVAEERAEQERLAKETEQNAKKALELIDASRAALNAGDTSKAQSYALDALNRKTQYDAAAQYALTDALGVYDMTDGFKADKSVVLPSEVIKQSVSKDGKYAAFLTSGQVNAIELSTGSVIAELPANVSALSDIVFTGTDTLLYAGRDALQAFDMSDRSNRWSAEGSVTSISVSEDGNLVAATAADGGSASIYDIRTGERRYTVSYGGLKRSGPVNAIFADPQDDIFALDATGRYLAVSFAGGALKIFDTADSDGEIEIFDESNYTFFEGGFYNRYFGFVASDGVNSEFFAIDMDALAMVGSLSLNGEMRLRVDRDGFCLSQGNVLVRLDIDTGIQTELAYTESGISAIARSEDYTLVKASDGKLLFYDANAILFDQHDDISCDFIGLGGEYAVLSGRDSPSARIMRLESRADQQLFTYDAGYSHDEARVSRDHKTVMLYDYRSFRLYSMNGEVLVERELPDAEQIYDQQYRRDQDGEYLEVIYNDGLARRYSASDGEILLETQGERQNDSLDEEFLTEKLRVVSPLHGTPVAYDLATGEVVRELESEDYLTYVTEVDGGIITEYITTHGQRYGLLLNEALDTLAYLPNLCDILPDGALVFDDMRGNLRETRVYSLQELTALAETVK